MFNPFKRIINERRAHKALLKAVKQMQAEEQMLFADLQRQIEDKLRAMPREEALKWCEKVRES